MTLEDHDAPPDADLLRAYRGDPDGERGRQAASALLHRYQQRVYLWCRRMMRDHDRALELSQEVLVRAFRGLAGFEERSGFSSWLFAIARNKCIAELRRPGLLRDDAVNLEMMADGSAAPDRLREEEVGEEELLRVIRRKLDPLEQEVLWLRCMERMPLDSITALLDLRERSGARGVLQRARRKLRAALRGLEPAPEPPTAKRGS